MPPTPKHLGSRQRRGQSTSAATLTKPEAETLVIPPLPSRDEGWCGMTKAWWRDIWASPMSSEWDSSDMHGLWVMAAVVDDFWNATSISARIAASAEIRLQAIRFGLSPIDRRRLEWQIEQTEEAVDKGKKRKARQKAAGTEENGDPAPTEGQDPRQILRRVQ